MSLLALCLSALGATPDDSVAPSTAPATAAFWNLQEPLFAAGIAFQRPELTIDLPPQEESKKWEFEITPYVWLAGIEADVEAGNLKSEVDVGFSDLLEQMDGGGALLATGKYERMVYWAQVDYYDFGDDSKQFNYDLQQSIVTGAVGWEFAGPFEGSRLGVLGGFRWTRLDAELEVGPVKADGTANLVDGIVMLRPDVQISTRWRFNPAMSIGFGDSELTYELWPQFQFQITERMAARIGYRRLYYRTDNGNAEFDGELSGLMLGLGVTF